MKKWVLILIFLMLMVSGTTSAEEYILSRGDVLNVSVFGYPELDLKEITIRSDGKIAVPLVGEVKAAGLSPHELSWELTTRLSQYYIDPRVTVNVARFRTTQVCVLGEVNRPGVYELGQHHNLIEALGAASGWTKDAAKTKVFIIRKDQPGTPLKVNLVEMLKSGDLSKNYSLNDGDIVYLTGNNRINFSQDVMPFVSTAYFVKHWGKNN